MTKADLMRYIGKKVHIYLKDRAIKDGLHGTLEYIDEYSEKYGFRKPGYFYIGNVSFKVTYIRKLITLREEKSEGV